MRILIYNFVQPDDSKSKQGGGVAVYQTNLLKALQQKGHDLIVLSCGDRYSLRPSTPYLTYRNDRFERVIIHDSPVFAPAHFSFHRIEHYFQNPSLDHIPGQLKAKYGTIDVFHFQNIEGLTAGFFRALRREFPSARILLSAHNYNLVCPQVNLWYREHKACEDYRNGHSCVNCVTFNDLQPTALNFRRLETILLNLRVKPHSRTAKAVEWIVRAPFRARRKLQSLLRIERNSGANIAPIVITSDEKAAQYRRYRETNIELSRDILDHIIAVSARTRRVLIDRGVPPEKVSVSYIGTTHHLKFRTARKITTANHHIHMAYLGYMRADKGFFFFLDALVSLHEEWAKNVSVTIAAPLWDPQVVERLRGMAYKYRDIRMFDGYSHDRLDSILAGVNLGVVPVLWEDNLPQVAIEMAARGIPLLTSDRGGAQEIGTNSDFIFKSESKRDFCAKLQHLLSGEVPLGAFWNNPTKIISMEDHLNELMRFYEGMQPPHSAMLRNRTAVASLDPALATNDKATGCEKQVAVS